MHQSGPVEARETTAARYASRLCFRAVLRLSWWVMGARGELVQRDQGSPLGSSGRVRSAQPAVRRRPRRRQGDVHHSRVVRVRGLAQHSRAAPAVRITWISRRCCVVVAVAGLRGGRSEAASREGYGLDKPNPALDSVDLLVSFRATQFTRRTYDTSRRSVGNRPHSPCEACRRTAPVFDFSFSARLLTYTFLLIYRMNQ